MLLLLPNLLDTSQDHSDYFPKTVDKAIFDIEGLFAEDEKNARLYLKRFSFSNGRTFRDIPIKLVNEHSKDQELLEYLELIKTKTWGLISDCGLPCLADPGSRLVRLAYQKKIDVKTFVGPSSIIMALQLSGMYCQQFTFLGYLPREAKDLEKSVKAMQNEIEQSSRVQVFIEAPYRNQKLLESLIEQLPSHFYLCVAVDLTLKTQSVDVYKVKEWKGKDLAAFQKRAAVFLVSKH